MQLAAQAKGALAQAVIFAAAASAAPPPAAGSGLVPHRAATAAAVKVVRRLGTLLLALLAAEASRRLARLLLQQHALAEQWSMQALPTKKPYPSTSKKVEKDDKANRKGDSAAELRECMRSGFQAVQAVGAGSADQVSVPFATPHGSEGYMVVLAWRQFAHLRALWGVGEAEFWSRLCDGELEGGTMQASGKSGSLFWYTSDKLFTLKSTSRSELRTLLEGLPSYIQHFVSNKSSLLCRIFAAVELRLDRRRLLLVVMNNVLAGKFAPHVVYDLKGTTEDRWVSPQPGIVLKDLNFADKIIGIADFRQKVELLHVLKKDARFLRDQNRMDYSVCLGVHYCEDDCHPPAEQLTPALGLSSSLALLRGFEPKFQCTLVREQAARRVVYYIGIIDVLQAYNLRKAVAHWVKSLSPLGWVHEIDTTPPHYYARRFKTYFWGKVQTFREPGDRVARFVRRLQTGIDNGTIPRPTFVTAAAAAPMAAAASTASPGGLSRVNSKRLHFEEVTMDESVDFAVRCGGHLQLLRRSGWLRSRLEEVEAFLDMDRHALVFQVMSRGVFGHRRTSAVACYKIRRVYLSIVCHNPRNRYCQSCCTPIKIEAEPVESRRFTIEADDIPLRCTAPSRRQAKYWVTALEVAAAYAEANVEDVQEAAVAAAATRGPEKGLVEKMQQPLWAPLPHIASLLGGVESYLPELESKEVLWVAKSAQLGLLEPYMMGPEAERRWEKRRVKWIFDFVDTEGTGSLSLSKVKTLWREMNINDAEGQETLSRHLKEAREGRRAGGGRQIGGGQVILLADFRRMLRCVDSAYVKAVWSFVGSLPAMQKYWHLVTEDGMPPELLARFFAEVQWVCPAASTSQVQRLLARLLPPLVTKARCLSPVGLAHLLCSPSNALTDPAKRLVFQDMTQPLCCYFIETSHNTYLEGNQLSSRSSVLRYVEVLRTGCRSVEIDVWDGKDGEPVVRHGYTVTTEVLFEDVIQAIADHAFVASEFPVILSIEQNCSALQRIKQGEILMKILGNRLLRPPWNEEKNEIDFEQFDQISPWSARHKFIVKSERGCCERCSSALPAYDRCIALPTKKLLTHEKQEIRQGYVSSGGSVGSRGPEVPTRAHCHVSSMTASKFRKLSQVAGEQSLRTWTSQHLQRVYPEGTRIGSGNMDPLPLWSSGVQMVAMNFQTQDLGLLMNEGLFRSYNGGCGYVLKPAELLRGGANGAQPAQQPPEGGGGVSRRRSRLRLRICCGHRLPKPEEHLADGEEVAGASAASPRTSVSSPLVVVCLEPSGQSSQTPPVAFDGYHPIFNHQVDFLIPEAPFHILTFEVREALSCRAMARCAVSLDAVREGFRWLALRSNLGNTIPHGGLLVFVEFPSR